MTKLRLFFLFLAIACLFPFLMTGYYQDDSANSLLRAYLAENNLTFFQFLLQTHRGWVSENGRFFPLALSTVYSIWYWMPSLSTYRLLQVGAVLGNLLLFIRFIQNLGGTLRLALLAATIVLGLFQLRDYHDPISSYACMMQIVLGLGMGSALKLKKYLEFGKTTDLVVSLALFSSSLLYYEVAYVFIPVLFLIMLRSTAPAIYRRRALGVFSGLILFYAAGMATLRLSAPLSYPGLQSGFGLKTLAAFVYQFSAALPLSYPFFGRSGFYKPATLLSSEFLSPSALFIGLTSGVFFLRLFRTPSSGIDHRSRSQLKWIGWILAVFPAALIAFSVKYQNEVTRPGHGYLPVYVSYFGVALLLALSLEKNKSPRLASGALSILLAITFSTNWIAMDRLNRYWLYPRTLLEKAIHQGLLTELPPRSRLVPKFDANWLSPVFIRQFVDKKTEVVPSRLFTQNGATRQDFFLDEKINPDGSGEVTLSSVLPGPPSKTLLISR